MKKSIVYQKYVISYLVILLIPLLSCTIYINSTVFRQYREQELSQSWELGEKASRELEKNIEKVNTYINQIRYDQNFSRVRYYPTQLNIMEAQKELTSYKASCSYLYSALYYYSNRDLYITPTSTFGSGDSYTTDTYTFYTADGPMNLPEMVKHAGEVTVTSGVVQGGGVQDFVAIVAPVPGVTATYSDVVIMLLSPRELAKTVENLLSDSYQYQIWDSVGHVFAGRMDGIGAETVPESFGSTAGEVIEQVGNRSYFTGKYALYDQRITVQVFLDTSILFQTIRQVQSIFFLLVTLALLCGFVLSLFLARYHYKPLQLLNEYIFQFGLQGGAERCRKGDEYTTIQTAFDLLKDSNQSLEQDAEKNEQFIAQIKQVLLKEEQQPSPQPQQGTDSRFDESLAYLEEHFCEVDFSIGGLCEKFGYAPNTYTAVFKKHMGKTPGQHLSEKRMDRAKELLITTDYPIRVLVEMVGYSDSSSFIKKFTRETGLSPTAYRDKFRVEQ